MALKMVNTLLGNIDVPGGHLGVPLDIRGFFIEPGEHGMLKPNPHILHPPVPFKFPADSLQMMEWFPLGMDAGHIAVDAVLNPEKYRLDYRPEVLLTYHSNPVWNMPAQEKVRQAIATFDYVISIDVVVNETTEWADLILPGPHVPRVDRRLHVRAAGGARARPAPGGDRAAARHARRDGDPDRHRRALRLPRRLERLPQLPARPHRAGGPGAGAGRTYTNDEIMDRFCRACYDDEHGLEWFKEHGHMVEKRPPPRQYLPYDGLRIPFYYEVIKTAGDQLRAQFAETGYEWDTSELRAAPVVARRADPRRRPGLPALRDHVQDGGDELRREHVDPGRSTS